jgi:hypothetical protein
MSAACIGKRLGAMSRMFPCSGGRSLLNVRFRSYGRTSYANSLLAILPVALETGYSEVVPELEPLQ